MKLLCNDQSCLSGDSYLSVGQKLCSVFRETRELVNMFKGPAVNSVHTFLSWNVSCRGQCNNQYFSCLYLLTLDLSDLNLHILSDLRSNYFRNGRPKSNFAQVRNEYTHIWSIMCVLRRESSLHPKSSTLVPDQPQPDRPAACVIAQQYSPAIFVSWRVHFRKEKFGAHIKYVSPYSIFVRKIHR